MRSRLAYAGIALGLFWVEVVIALFVHDRFVRPYAGDSIAVMLAYAAFRAIFGWRIVPAVVAATGLAVAIEFGQLFGLLRMLGLSANPVARIVLGSGFDPRDFLAYAAGAVLLLTIESLPRVAGRSAGLRW